MPIRMTRRGGGNFSSKVSWFVRFGAGIEWISLLLLLYKRKRVVALDKQMEAFSCDDDQHSSLRWP